VLVVADSSPLIYLSRVRLLHILAALFGEVVVPRTEWNEAPETLVAMRVQGAEVQLTAYRDAEEKAFLVRLPGQEQRRVWHLDEGGRLVSAAEFELLTREQHAGSEATTGSP